MRHLFCVSLLTLWISHPALADPSVEPFTQVHGISQAEWSKVWWQWAGSFAHDQSPITDQTGELCGLKQKGPVWFLAGTYGTHRTVRTCKVPKDKYLFFPLINYVVMRSAYRQSSCMTVMSEAATLTNHVAALVLEVDGTRVDNLNAYRQATPCFDMGELAEPKTRVFPSAANGYYVMLKPLSPGKHVVHFGGALPDMLQAVSYTLLVE